MMRPCDLCGRSMTATVELNEGRRAFRCPDCDLLVTDASHDPEDVARENRLTYRPVDMLRTYLHREKEFRWKYDRILATARRFLGGSPPRQALEIGSNIGFFSDHLQRNGVRVTSVEINRDLREVQRAVYGIEPLSRLEDIGPGEAFDVVFLMDVLEHIPGPSEYLARAGGLLREGGILFLQCPNKNALTARLLGPRWHWWSAPDHLYHFSERSLRLMAARARLETLSVTTVSPVLDEMVNLPRIGILFSPLMLANRCLPLNRFVALGGGMLLQAVLGRGRI